MWRTVCFALFLRELQSQFNDKLGLAWAFVEPFLLVFGLAYIRSVISSSDVHGVPIMIFMMVGMITIQSFITPLNKVANAFTKNKPLYAFRQVQPIAGLLVSVFIEYAIKAIVVVLSIVALYLLDLTFEVHDALLLLTLFHLLWLMTFSMSCLFGIAMTYHPEVKKVINIFTRPLFFISCVFFSLQDIPKEYWHWFTWNPLVHIIELARYACYESYGDEGISFAYPLEFTLVVTFFAVSLYHITWKGLLSR
ncbi:ABC transporter permease [Alteromonas gilva]|uniref:Transport permease protein n=1 Tax=Alteromonas gilva TaxID=2987522 RepID=A0ABT5L828_9ALTE|nr:ABC transporter permease [Alteromonas gilva]MDC8832676.1 ABC transporter permease [Alteromonas gilva]